MSKFKASMERGNPPEGTHRCVVSLKGHRGARWEFDGKVPVTVGNVLMAMAISQGKRSSLREGADLGIELAFQKGGA